MSNFNPKPRAVVKLRFGEEVIARYASLDKAVERYARPGYSRWAYIARNNVDIAGSTLGLAYADGSEIEFEELLRVFGPRHEDEHADFRGQGPVYGVHKTGGKYRSIRHPKTTGTKRAHCLIDVEAGEPPVRRKQSAWYLPSAWDDLYRGDQRDRNWKRNRTHQWA